MYNKPNAEFIEKLKAIAPGRVFAGADVNEDYSHDEMDFAKHYAPDAVVQVLTTEEVSAVCKLCYECDVPFTPRGAGTGLSGACVALAGGIIIDMAKMNKILDYDLGNFVVRIQPGVLVDEMQKDALAHGVMYAPDPGEKLATIGGNVSTNAGGMRAVKYGCTRDFVRAMTVVLPTGEVMKFGGEVAKNCSGYSMMNLISGSEGTLCIITELSMKLLPIPTNSISLLGLFADLDTAVACVSKLKMANLDPESIELQERCNVVDTQEFLGGKKVYAEEVEGTPIEAYLLSTITASSQEELDAKMEKAAEVFVENGALDVSVYDTADGIRDVWSVRGNALELMKAKFSQMEECDIVVPIPKISDYIRYAKQIGEELGAEVRCTGHAGDGNIHTNICCNGLEPAKFAEMVQVFIDKLSDKGIELGGLVSGEHGIGYSRVPQLTRQVGEEEMALMKRVKMAFDPKLLLNPGKVCYSL